MSLTQSRKKESEYLVPHAEQHFFLIAVRPWGCGTTTLCHQAWISNYLILSMSLENEGL